MYLTNDDFLIFIKLKKIATLDLMTQPLWDPHSSNRQHEENHTQLLYEPNEVEGECVLHTIQPVKLDIIKYAVYILLSVILIGIPVLILYWYPNLKRFLYFSVPSIQQATHLCILNYDETYTITKKKISNFYETEQKVAQHIYFYNRYLKYIVSNQTVKAAIFDFKDKISRIAKTTQQYPGLSDYQATILRQSYGLGAMIIDKPSLLTVFFREVFRPLYIFIILSIILWSADNYYIYAAIIFLTAVVSIGISLYETYKLNEKIFQMAYYETQVNVLRSGQVIKMSSLHVVPGDIVFLKQPIKIPFEGVIMEGSALINECALTGQSLPIVKKASTNESYQNGIIDKSSIIYEGTTLLQANYKKSMIQFDKYRQKYGIPVCVIRTNFVTMKGQLIRLISFPKQRQNTFQKQSSKFLIFLFILAVLTYSVIFIKLHNELTVRDIIIKFFDLIAITVPPGLPISMTVGIVFAINKMKQLDIYCISPDKVVMGGMVDFVCFDKTGTLTQDFMDFYCFLPSYNRQFQKQIDQNEKNLRGINFLQENQYLFEAIFNMATNHSVVKLQNTNQLVGDPMEVKMLQFIDFSFSNNQTNADVVHSMQNIGGLKLDVLRRFQFDSEIQRMGVISTSNKHNDNYLYMKGAPEIMLKILDPSTIPKNYAEILKKYASMGLRVLAIGSKVLQVPRNKLKTIKLQEVQNNLKFNGFEVFQNKLKPETYDAITQLFEAQIPCVMITGDNTLTGTNIAYKCGIADKNKNTSIIDLKDGKIVEEPFLFHDQHIPQQQNQKHVYLSQDHKNQLYEIELNDMSNKKQAQLPYLEKQNQQYFKKMCDRAIALKQQFTITGAAFNYLFPGSVQKVSGQAALFLSYVRVYARAKPNQKAKVVMIYQSCGKITAMCGDGANDCGALKQADAGLSLSQAQASISSPFTSKITNISSMVTLLKQCRAGLVTNFSLFNIMALYSLIQFTTTVICQFYYSYPSDFQFLYWDLACNFFFFLLIGYTGTAQKLSYHKPSSSLFTFSNMFYVMFMAFFQFIGQLLILLSLAQIFAESTGFEEHGTMQYNKRKYDQQQEFYLDSQIGSALFLFSNYMYLFSMLSFCISRPWRKQFYTNIPFLVILIVTMIYSTLLIIYPASRISLLRINYMESMNFNWFVFVMSALFGVILYVNQKYLLEPFFGWLRLKYPSKKWL